MIIESKLIFLFLNTILRKAKLNFNDVSIEDTDFENSTALIDGDVDAIIGAYRNFEPNEMKIGGVESKCFYIEEVGILAYDELIFIANKKNIKKKNLIKFLKAIEKATQYIVNYPEESWEIFAKVSLRLTKHEKHKIQNKKLYRKSWFDTIPRFALRPGALDKGRYNRFEKFLHKEELITKKLSYNEIAIEIFE